MRVGVCPHYINKGTQLQITSTLPYLSMISPESSYHIEEWKDGSWGGHITAIKHRTVAHAHTRMYLHRGMWCAVYTMGQI